MVVVMGRRVEGREREGGRGRWGEREDTRGGNDGWMDAFQGVEWLVIGGRYPMV